MKAAWGEKVGVGQRYAEKREEHKIKIAGEVKNLNMESIQFSTLIEGQCIWKDAVKECQKCPEARLKFPKLEY